MEVTVRFKLKASHALIVYGDYRDLLKRTVAATSKTKYTIEVAYVNDPDGYGIIEALLLIDCPSKSKGSDSSLSNFAMDLKDRLQNRTNIKLGKHVLESNWK